MRYYAQHGLPGPVLDLDENRLVPRVVWVDVEAGLLEAYETDAAGQIRQDAEGSRLWYRARGRFRFLTPAELTRRASELPAAPSRPKLVMGAPRCARCSSTLTLPGDDLCPACRACERGQANRMRCERMPHPLLNRPCSVAGCTRLAAWSVADEVAVTPAQQGRTLYERGATVGRRFYCSWHYQPPRILDARGEVIEELHEAGGVRPE